MTKILCWLGLHKWGKIIEGYTVSHYDTEKDVIVSNFYPEGGEADGCIWCGKLK